MKQETPTYMGWWDKLGVWGFSPSPIKGATTVWNISDWTWEEMAGFMNEIPESQKHQWLIDNKISVISTDKEG